MKLLYMPEVMIIYRFYNDLEILNVLSYYRIRREDAEQAMEIEG